MRNCVAVLVAAAWLMPPVASAQEPVASAVLYEVNEALRFLKPNGRRDFGSRADFARRLARASLLGKDVRPVGAHDLFKEGQFIQAEANSAVNLNTGSGPVHGRMLLLTDLDPTRESLDTLLVEVDARIAGTLDLTTATTQGYATLSGTWNTGGKGERRTGTLQGLFLIPFGMDGKYFYVDLGVGGPGSLCGSTDGVCPLADDEFALGIPLTKLVVAFFE
jgi:hypothetical protein